ncbi:TetR/AcrR family transcriptional regulator [Actinoplanes sichuanensis]|uniref:TetR/AcrR family transcriptional regulator n=1 Tax=Actinoplanes sichuanensis TaxID=512349 RepID=A0ABW4A373_9ACTN|nr:TetR family transcriptional regulator [Actinoplanes sichuanensis]
MEEGTGAKTVRRNISAADRRKLLVAAALRVMRRDGIAAATTRAICAEAGMPHGAFHYCFHTKKDLYAAVLASDREIDLDDAWPDIRPEATPEENIATMLTAYWTQIESDPGAQQVLFELGNVALRDPELQDLPQAEHRESLEKATGYITRLAKEAGFTYLRDEAVLADLVLATLNGVAWSWLSHRDDARARAGLDQFAAIFANLVRTT